MANEVKIVLTAVDKASGVLKQAGSNVKATGVNWNAAFTAVGAGAAVAFGAVTKFVGDAISSTVQYADQVRDLGRLIGASAEESSKLIQAADDVFVSYEELTAGMRVAIRKGIEPSIEGIGKLSDEYLAIQDPIARSKFLMDTFGRAGAKLAPLLEKGSAGIAELGEAAEAAGLVMDQEGVDAALHYKESLDALNDSFMGLKITVGQAVLPALTALATNTNDLLQMIEDEGIQGFVTWNEKWAELARAADTFGVAIDDLTIGMSEQDVQARITAGSMLGIGSAIGATKDEAEKARTPLEELAGAFDAVSASIGGKLGPEMIGFRDTTAELKDQAAELRDRIGELEAKKWLSSDQKTELAGLKGDLKDVEGNITATADAHDEATRRILFNLLVQRAETSSLSAEAKDQIINNIALSWGLVDTATYNAMKKADDFFSDIENGAAASEEDIRALDRTMRGLPASHTFDLIIKIQKIMYESTIYDNNRQHGGPVSGGRPYLVGEAGPEIFVPNRSGKIISNDKAMSGGQAMSGGGGGITIGEINVFATDGMDEETVAQMVIARLSAASRHSGYAGLEYAG